MNTIDDRIGHGHDTPKQRFGLRRWGVRTRILATICLLAIAALVVGIGGLTRMSDLSDKAEQVYAKGAAPLDALRTLQALTWQQRAYESRAMTSTAGPEILARDTKFAADTKEKVTALRTSVGTLPLVPDARAAFDGFETAMNDYDSVLESFTAVQGDELTQLILKLQGYEATATEELVKATEAQAAYARQTAKEAADEYATARLMTIIILVVSLGLAIAFALLVAQSVVRPLQRVRSVLDKAAAGDLQVRVVDAGKDELADVSRSLNLTLDSLGGVLRMVNQSAADLASTSQVMAENSGAIASNMQEVAKQTTAASSAAGEVSVSVETVATGTEEMEAAIRDIAQNANDAAHVAETAVSAAQSTTRTVEKLGESSQEIASVVKLITSIAEQTNLLALNATIEAARAGEAGKGFAVVANEVKDLAQETAKATEDISAKVSVIQADTTSAVGAIEEISQVIDRISSIQTTIAAAVEQQSATTKEMSRNVSGAANGARSIAGNISGLAASTDHTNERLADAEQATATLARMSADLRQAVARFSV